MVAYVVGVGGFLGIGAKNVALAPSSFQVVPASDRGTTGSASLDRAGRRQAEAEHDEGSAQAGGGVRVQARSGCQSTRCRAAGPGRRHEPSGSAANAVVSATMTRPVDLSTGRFFALKTQCHCKNRMASRHCGRPRGRPICYSFAAMILQVLHLEMSFAPDTMLVQEVVASPNFGERADGRLPDMMVLHYTGMPTAQAALDRLLSPLPRCPAIISSLRTAASSRWCRRRLRAWHAGEGSWNGEDDVNSSSIGIEIVNPGHDNGYPEFPQTSDRRGGGVVPQHPAAARDPHGSHSCAFGHGAFAQARSGREISLGCSASLRCRALGGAGADRARPRVRARRQRQRDPKLPDGVRGNMVMAFRPTASSTKSPVTW